MIKTPQNQLELRIRGMDCADCASTLERGVMRLHGVDAVSVDFATAVMFVSAEDGAPDAEAVIGQVRRLGYDIAAEELPTATERRGFLALKDYFLSEPRARLALTTSLLAIAGGAMSLSPAFREFAFTSFVTATLVGLAHPARAGWGALRSGRGLDINVLMTLAAIGALVIGQVEEAATVMALFNLGESLETFALDRTRASVRALVQLAPRDASLIAHDHERLVPVEHLRRGDRIRVRPGERLPADGVIASGESSLDESPVTGESLPVDKGPGDPVYAGAINGHSALTVEVSRAGAESTLARIARLVEQAQRERSRSQRLVDRFARWYTPAVVVAAVGLAVVPPLFGALPFQDWLYRGLVLLVVSCPCALVISTPVSVLSGLARAARLGLLVRGGEHLERLSGLRVIAFDKTGTLTRGRPALERMRPADDRLLAIAAAVEQSSEHPLAQAIRREARHRSLSLPAAEGFTALPGRGARARVDGRQYSIGSRALWPSLPTDWVAEADAAEARGHTVLILGDETGPLAMLAIADEVRPESAAAIAALRRHGIQKTVLLTGDNARTAASIAHAAGIDEFAAGLLPENKAEAVAKLVGQYGDTVAMVGDGINDAPALARAPVGIAMGAGGTGVAIEAATIALMRDDLRLLPTAIRLGQATRRVILQNVALSILAKAIFIGLAFFGWTTLWLAVLADMGASLLVTFNGMRLLRLPEEHI